MNRIIIIFINIFFCWNVSFAQAPSKPTSAEIHHAIKKLNVLGSALYLAAHPDDENTRLISYLANEMRINTAYLSLTRGDGGQNLIGPEMQELLGLIRTQELLAARRTDGGQQFFTRANDFGYSKNPEETLEIWEKEKVLADVVWTIRKFQPDVIINRFSHDSGRKTHGHHTSSAVLSYEAFNLTGDKTVYPAQLKYVDTWQPKRLFFNTSWWFYGSRDKFAEADKSKMLSVDVGVYYPLLGKSNTEIAAESRSMHRCQGFGSTGTRGTRSEYLQLLKGEMPKNKEDIFDGINTTWTRVKGGASIGVLITEVDQEFKNDQPQASIPKLMKAYKLIKNLPDSYWKKVKQKEIEKVIEFCLALYLEAVADTDVATTGQQVELTIEMINRLGDNIQLNSVSYLPMQIDSTLNLVMDKNQAYEFSKMITLPNDIQTTNAYWLNKKWEMGMYEVDDQLMRGVPETPRAFQVQFSLMIEGESVELIKDVVFKKNDPVKGEVYQPFEITPPVFANIADKVYVFGDDKPKEVNVLVKSGKENIKGNLKLVYPNGWTLQPASFDFELEMKGAEKLFTFQLIPPTEQSEGLITVMAEVDGTTYHNELVSIDYDHIPRQTVLREGTSKIVKIDLKKEGQKVGYIVGAGDAIPTSLEQIGYQVTLLEDKDMNLENFKRFDAIIMGIRAYNTVDRLKFHQQKLMDYVAQGGTMIVQYNTSHRLVLKDLAPFDLTLSRDRVTKEEADIRLLNKDHRVLNFPNKISNKDFDGWVQERGLYFPNEWSEEFEPILSSNDPGETPKNGGLLVAKHGKGYYIYSGYSWFRQLPAGVPGAYRLFTNMISIGQKEKRP